MMRSRTLSALVALVLLGACGGSPSTSSEPAPQPSAGSEQAASPEPATAESSPWDALDEAALRELVRERATARIAEVQPDFDVSALDAYLADPEKAPPMSGRTVERLFDLAIVAIGEGDLERAEGIVRLVRARAKNRNSAYAGTTLLTEIARRKAGEAEEAHTEAVAAVFRELPRARFGTSTVIFQLFQKQEQLGAEADQIRKQMVALESASNLLFFTQVLPTIVAHRDRFLAAIDAVKAEHEKKPEPRPYDFATVDLARARDAKPVRIAVWDVGTEPELFEEQLFTNEAEQPNGQDDDGNGLVDDIHGVVADGDAPHTALLFDPGEEVLSEYADFLKGIMDLRAGLATTGAAQQVLSLMRSVTDADALVALEKNLNAVGEWAHGTHVAGIMLAGVPKAELAIFRSAWAGEARPYFHRGPTDEELAAERANVEAIADFINRHEIRVVNASLGFSKDYLEDALRHETDKYETDEEVRARAEEIHRHRTATWRHVFEACPKTLFVVAAGNSNRDVVEYGDVPSSLELPNVLTVGAVDKWGNWATFTNSNPERVRVFDFGVAVPSLVPSGEEVPLSGTSMASPNAANLAAKILSVNPALEPADVIELIEETGDEIAAPFNGRIANEKKAVTQARRARRR